MRRPYFGRRYLTLTVVSNWALFLLTGPVRAKHDHDEPLYGADTHWVLKLINGTFVLVAEQHGVGNHEIVSKVTATFFERLFKYIMIP